MEKALEEVQEWLADPRLYIIVPVSPEAQEEEDEDDDSDDSDNNNDDEEETEVKSSGSVGVLQ